MNFFFLSVLFLARIQLTFFLGTDVVQCCWFRKRMVLVTYWYVSCCWIVLILNQRLFSFLCCFSFEKLGVHRELRGNRARTADLSWPKGYRIQYDIILNNKTRVALAGVSSGNWLDSSRWMVSSCVVHHLFYIVLLYIYYCCYYYFLFLFCPV